MPAALVLTMTPDVKTARRLAELLVDRKLAACVSIQRGWASRYRWKGKIESAKETLLLIKTTDKMFSKVLRVIEKNHPYEVSEILSLPVRRGSRKYLAWLESSVR